MNTKILGAVAIVVVVGVGALALENNNSSQSADTHETAATTTEHIQQAVDNGVKPSTNMVKPESSSNTAADTPEAISIEKYVTKHISEFSPVKEQLGGKFQVTKVSAHGGAGTVTYEDGHSSYTADFKYSIDEFGSISIDSFVVRK